MHSNKTIVVTGAASGIGAATARLLARQGAKVIAVDRNPPAAGLAAIPAGSAFPAEAWTSAEKLATLPAESFWRQLQQRFGDSQAATQMAVTAQAGFVRGLQEAVQAWQKQTTEALGTVASTTAFGDPTWSNLFKPWEQLLPTGSTGQTASGKPATKGSR